MTPEKYNESYIDHEIRIRMIENVNKKNINRLNALITIVLTGFGMPMLFKYFVG